MQVINLNEFDGDSIPRADEKLILIVPYCKNRWYLRDFARRLSYNYYGPVEIIDVDQTFLAHEHFELGPDEVCTTEQLKEFLKL